MVEYKVIIILDIEYGVDFSEEFMKTLSEIGSSEAIEFPVEIPIAKLRISRELGKSTRNKIAGYLSRKFKGIIIKGLKVKEIKLKLKEEEDGS